MRRGIVRGLLLIGLLFGIMTPLRAMYLVPPTDAHEGSPIEIDFVDDYPNSCLVNLSSSVVGNAVALYALYYYPAFGCGPPPPPWPVTYRFQIGTLPAGNYSVGLVAFYYGPGDFPPLVFDTTFTVAPAAAIPTLNAVTLALLSTLVALSGLMTRSFLKRFS
jgi:hypothetical protein